MDQNILRIEDIPIYLIYLKRKPERLNNARKELNNIGINNYIEFEGTDGWIVENDNIFLQHGIDKSLCDRKGLAGCACSHIRIWKEIIDKNIPWTIVFEDDVHFHPNFLEFLETYLKNIPENADIVYLGYHNACCKTVVNKYFTRGSCACTHAYIVSLSGAKTLLNVVDSLKGPIDMAMETFYWENSDNGYSIHGGVAINGIIPDVYKVQNRNKYTFDGVVYQNQRDLGSTIHRPETLFGV